MIYEIEDDTYNLDSTYNIDYNKKLKKICRTKPFYPKDEDSNCIIDFYKEHLNTQQKNKRLPPKFRIEEVADFFNKVRNERPYFKKFSPEDLPDEAVIEREQNKLVETEYQNNFSKNSDVNDSFEEERSIKIVLPKNRSIPETTQLKHFRDPRNFSSTNKTKTERQNLRPPDHLNADEKEREILKIRTGNTEYQEIIGKLGHRVIKEQFYGPSLSIKSPEEQINSPNSARSICSEILMNSSKNYVLSQII